MQIDVTILLINNTLVQNIFVRHASRVSYGYFSASLIVGNSFCDGQDNV